MEREKIRSMFSDILAEAPDWAAVDAEARTKIIAQLERGCYNAAITECTDRGIVRAFSNPPFVERYSAKCMLVSANLRPSVVLATTLLRRILDGTVAASSVAGMSSEQLCPESSARERSEIDLRSRQKIDRKLSRMHKCRKCGRDETVYLDFQMARGDEDSTLSIKCIHCQHVWRQ